MALIIPPIKCQGIKTKLVPTIKGMVQSLLDSDEESKWIEPFCGSCVVALNVRPGRALLADTNKHIINVYRAIQGGSITPDMVREYLSAEGEMLRAGGDAYYYEVRTRFNANPNPLDFIFLSRSCFNGVMRFNKSGLFNVPFCRKPNRFSKAYITKIVNQVSAFGDVVRNAEWVFEVSDFQNTLSKAIEGDLVYADPPYSGRHVDYFNTWTETSESLLIELLNQLPCKFILSTWHSNRFRTNSTIQQHWDKVGYWISFVEHFYHVGSTEELRHSMKEALIMNFASESVSIDADVFMGKQYELYGLTPEEIAMVEGNTGQN